ncbi:hypothetical protein KUF71_015170 [Frankliniella fusca]|uniref:Uncharacterized protein n=1 Tax=Frankliniella fusca TaxID=407009 RepID=A0AAE1HSX7_9NEOP|nr:hypothetical protein KUF71_015170 [Frankliniella fusca]
MARVTRVTRHSAMDDGNDKKRKPVSPLQPAVSWLARLRRGLVAVTGLAPCPNGAPPARECLVSVLVDLRALRALRARARERERERAERNNSTAPPQDTQVALPREDPRPDPAQDQQEQELPQQAIDVDLRLEHEQQQRRQQQLEQAVRFQEDELQQLREQVQELRQQLARALQLYQLTSAAARPPPLPAPLQYQASVKSLPLQLRGGGGGAGSTGFFHPQSPPVVPRPAPDLRAGFTGYGPAHEGAARRFYRTLPPAASKVASPATASATATTSAPVVSAPIYGQRLRYVGLRELARGDTVVAT